MKQESDINKRSQVGLLYFLAGAWNALWITGFLSGKQGRPLVLNILTPFLLVLYLYLLIRFAAVEHQFIRKYPFAFYGSVAVGFLPWIAFFIIVFVLYRRP